ncbi:pseudo-response regulator 1 [Klebsormidium nitens]|uniref:Pseudo-response regulator 1 n=1 Tax=Klebsormidium nitens TaxID=105231 RepID=A0A1Y1HPX0_KLENI|nr:pseudo-response regulator 1 [Klebsormidium nitens]|eukprot:GAQ80670.1 pseudo-response regulator 1 [Klebsormidium nitens]
MDDKRFHDVTTFHRSSVHILLADRDLQTRKEVFELLRRCSYKVTAVESAKHVLEVLRAGGPAVDVILSEVEFPHGKGLKLLKHIMREEKLKQIPVVMMSQRDEMALVVKSLRLGAADYLVKPLRTNELLNLWTHMWRRRRMLGMADRLSGHPNMNGPPLDLAFSNTSDSNSGSVDMLSNETVGERRTRLEGQVNEDNERDREDSRPQMSPVLSLSLKPSSEGVEIKAKSGYEMLPLSRKPSYGSPAKFRTPPAPPPNNSLFGHTPKRMRGGEIESRGFSSSAREAPEQTSGESQPPFHQPPQLHKFVPSSGWHPNGAQHAPQTGSSSTPHRSATAEGVPAWAAPRVSQQPPAQEHFSRGALVHSHGQEMQQRGHNVERRDSLPTPPEYGRTRHVGASSNAGNSAPPPEYHRSAFQGDARRGTEGGEGSWQNSHRPPYFPEPQFAGMVPSNMGAMAQLPPHFYMPPHVQGGGRESSKADYSSGGSGRDHSPPTVTPPREERSQSFGEAASGMFGMPPQMQNGMPPQIPNGMASNGIPNGMAPQLPNGMQLPSDLLMNPHLAMFNLPPGMMPPMPLPPGMPPGLAAGLMGQMQFSPFFQNMLNPHLIRPPVQRVPTPPPPPNAQPQSKPPQVRSARFSPPPPTTGGPVIGVSVGGPPAPMWPLLQAGVDRKMDQAERREAALSKFRQKRKDRCFAKKIRYASRKKLAEARPRIKGQFVRQKEGGAPGGGGDEEELEEEEEEEEEDVDEEEEDENKGAQLPDISGSLNGSNDSQSALNIESR